MRILIVLLLGFLSLAAASPSRPEVPKRKAPVRATAARAHAHAAGGKANKPAIAARKARNRPARPKVYHK